MNGALCMELLTTDGWNPVNDIESVIVSIRSLLVVGDGRLEAATQLESDEVRAAATRKKKAAAAAAAAADGKKDVGDDSDIQDPKQPGGEKRFKNEQGKAKAAVAGGARDDLSDESMEENGAADKNRSKVKKRVSENISAGEIGSYSASEARSAYSHLSDYHKRKGWDSSGWWARKG
jgi:ubiquitin-conjugating enzyme E2 Q